MSLTMDSFISGFLRSPEVWRPGEVSHWQPKTAPGVSAAESLDFLRPVGPPPAGSAAVLPEVASFSSRKRAFEVEEGGEDSMEDVLPPPAKKRRLIKDPAQFRDVAKYLETSGGGDEVSIEALCPICSSILQLPDAVMPAPYRGLQGSGSTATTLEPLMVLPCGHLLGADCMATHLRYKDLLAAEDPWVEGALPDCPMCRFPLAHEGCGHDIELRPYDRSRPRREQLPHTLPEGGHVGEHCRACVLDMCNDDVGEFCDIMFPDVRDDDYVDTNVLGPGHVDELRARVREMLRALVQWQAQGVLDW